MSVKRQNYLLLVTGLVLGVLVSIGHGVLAERESAQATLPVEELRTFSDVFGRIKNDYVESVEDKELLENAIRGMLTGLDPHSSYLSPRNSEEYRIQMSLSYFGIGASLQTEDYYVKIAGIIAGGPAAIDGRLQPEDKITGVGQGAEGDQAQRPHAHRHAALQGKNPPLHLGRHRGLQHGPQRREKERHGEAAHGGGGDDKPKPVGRRQPARQYRHRSRGARACLAGRP